MIDTVVLLLALVATLGAAGFWQRRAEHWRAKYDAATALADREWTALTAQNGWLKEQLEAAYAHRRRMERVDRKLPEREPAPPTPPEAVPEHIEQLIGLYDSSPTREMLRGEVKQARRHGQSWAAIERELIGALPPELLTEARGDGT
jgi:hypothetical protein